MATNQSTLLKTKNTQHNRPSSEPVFDLFVLPHSKVTSTVLLSSRWFMLMKTWLWISRSFFADRSSKSLLILHTGPFLFTQLPVILNYRHLLPTLHHHPLSPCWNTPCIVTCFTHMLFHLPRHPPLVLPASPTPRLQHHTPSSPSPSCSRLCLVTWATGRSWPALPCTLCWGRAGWWPRRTTMRYGSHHGHLISPYHCSQSCTGFGAFVDLRS